MARDSGIGTEYVISYPIALTIMAFIAIAMYNVIEPTLAIFTTFRRRNGLYLYSLLPCMITGQSLVLYSRLHLTARGTMTRRRWVLIMIIVDATICHVPIIVLLYGANSSNPDPFLTPYSTDEKVQVTIFFIQEVMISGIYVYNTMKLLRSEGNIRGRNSRNVMMYLVWVNLIIIALDITLLSIEYAGFYDIQTTYKAAVYSVKLKMEFSILNKLLDLVQGRIHDSSDDPRSRSHRTTKLGNIKKSHKKSNPTTNGTANGIISSSTLGNSAYARMDDGSVINLKGMEVVKTTEVRVERSERDIIDVDLESLEDRNAKGQGTRRKSLSLSLIQIVRNRE